jgi:hypothetical protein
MLWLSTMKQAASIIATPYTSIKVGGTYRKMKRSKQLMTVRAGSDTILPALR